MHSYPMTSSRNILIAIIAVAVLAAVAFAFRGSFADRERDSGGDLGTEPREATLSGALACLPKKGSDGPQTLECAFGVRADDGYHYGLDISALDPGVSALPIGTRVVLAGTLVPIEAVSTDQWQTYDIRGIMSARSLEQVQ